MWRGEVYLPILARLTAERGMPVAWRVLLALGLTAAAALLRLGLEPLTAGVVPFATFYVSTVLAALAAGAVAGAVAAIVAALAAWALFLPGGAGTPGLATVLNLALFLVTQGALVLLAVLLRRVLGRAAAAERSLNAKVAELEALMDLAPVGIWFARAPEVRDVTRNRFAAELLRAPPDTHAALAPATPEAPKLSHVELRRGGARVPPADLPLQRAMRGEQSRDEEFEAVFADGSSISLLSNASPIRDGQGRLLGAVSASLDVTALKRTEAALREAIAARELLQREADHRIKNSLQLVASMLRLQRARVADAGAIAALDDAVARVGAVAQAHAALQGSPDLRSADAGAMVEDLCRFVGGLNADVRVTCLREGDTSLDMERAIPLGLVVSELLTNAVRHAYPPGAAGEVEVRLTGSAERLEVSVRDQGRGMEGSATRPGSLGRDLVRTLSVRIGAEVDTWSRPGEGTRVTLHLPKRETHPAETGPPAAAEVGIGGLGRRRLRSREGGAQPLPDPPGQGHDAPGPPTPPARAGRIRARGGRVPRGRQGGRRAWRGLRWRRWRGPSRPRRWCAAPPPSGRGSWSGGAVPGRGTAPHRASRRGEGR
jgi:two-component sensor histidine kinase